MIEKGNMTETCDQYETAANDLFAYVRDMIYKPSDAALDIDGLPGAFVNLGKGLEYLFKIISEAKDLAKELAVGDLNCALPSANNEIAAPLKSLHASLKHLTWQTQQVAKGDYDQRVEFMGDFSAAFNNMIEQLKRQNKINLEEKARLKTYVDLILESIANPLLVFDGEDSLVYASDSWFRYCSLYTHAQASGKQIGELLAPIVSMEALTEINRSYYNAAVKQQIVEHELDIDFGYHKAVSHFRIQYTPMMTADGYTDGIMAFLFDMTESEHARQEAERARMLAESSSQAKSTFLAKMSHEIRTPMNAIIGMTELALREDSASASKEHLLTIKQAGLNLLSIINDILDFSKIETGKLEIIPSEYLFSSLINDVINIIKTRVLESRLRFIVNIDCDIPNILTGDSTRIRQIMLNLLGNAVKYTDKGFISISVRKEDIDENTISLIIDVTDSGRGIKQEAMPTLFEEFAQFDKENINVEGAGLGLAIAESLVSAMNGRLECVSEYGKGSTFTVAIPQAYRHSHKIAVVMNPENKYVLIYERREVCIQSIIETMANLGVQYCLASTEDEFLSELMSKKYSFVFVAAVLYEIVKRNHPDLQSNAEFALIAEFGEAIRDRGVSIITTPIFCLPVANFLNGVSDGYTSSLNKKTEVKLTAPKAAVLVVDDINTNLTVAEGLLQPYMMRVDLCKSGNEAIEAVKNNRYDIVFMDHMMPEMDGLEATAKIRALSAADPHYSSLPVIALTANAVSGTRELFLDNGFNDFLSKPIDVLQLNDMLKKWIPKEKQVSAPAYGDSYYEDDLAYSNSGIYIEGVNVKKGISMTGGTVNNYIKVLKVFIKDGYIKLGEIRKSYENENISLYTIYLHGLKSACAIIGAEKLYEDSLALEMASKRGDLIYIHNHNAALLSDLESLLENIDVTIEINDSSEPENGGDTVKLAGILCNLASALDCFDLIRINQEVGALHDYTRMACYGEIVEDIIYNKVIGDYDAAISDIGGLLEKLRNDELRGGQQ